MLLNPYRFSSGGGGSPIERVSVTPTSGLASQTTHAVNLPAVTAGDLLIMQFNFRHVSSTISSPPSGWTELGNTGSTGGNTHLYIWYKVASGSEGSTVSVTLTSAATAAAQVHQIRNYSGSPEAGAFSSTASSSPDADAYSPSWGAASAMWIVLFGCRGDPAVSAYPYTDGESAQSSGTTGITGSAQGCASCITSQSASPFNPGAYTLSDSRTHVVVAIAIRSSG